MKQPLWIPVGIMNFLLEGSADYVYYDEENDYVALVDKDMGDFTFVVRTDSPVKMDKVVGVSLSAVLVTDVKARKGVFMDVARFFRDAIKRTDDVETLKHETTKRMESHVKRIVRSLDEFHDLTPWFCTTRFAMLIDLIEEYKPNAARVALPNTQYSWFVVRATFGDTTLYHLSFPRNYNK